MSASALLLIEPTNEMTRSSSGIRIANAPAEKKIGQGSYFLILMKI